MFAFVALAVRPTLLAASAPTAATAALVIAARATIARGLTNAAAIVADLTRIAGEAAVAVVADLTVVRVARAAGARRATIGTAVAAPRARWRADLDALAIAAFLPLLALVDAAVTLADKTAIRIAAPAGTAAPVVAALLAGTVPDAAGLLTDPVAAD